MKYKKHLIFLLLLFISVIPLLDLFNAGFPVTHDGQDHIARIANFYQNLKEGNIIPRWAGNLNWGYGHPILMFLYPIPSYSASFFHFLGFPFVDSIKIVFGLFFILSGLTMYLWARELFGTWPGFFAGVLYLFAPYRFVDLYVRGAIGEHAAFIFPPLILYFLLKLSKKYSYLYVLGGSLSLSGLILSHNAISLMFLPLIIFYIYYLISISKDKKNLVYSSLKIFLLGFGAASFFWIPAFFEGRYTLRNIVTAGEYVSRFVEPNNLIYSPWNYGGSGEFTVQIGIVHILMFIISPFIMLSFRAKNKNTLLISGLFMYSLLTIFLMLQASDFIWQKFMIMQNFQFPWRFLSVAVFTTSVLGAFFATNFTKKKQIIICVLFIIVSILISRDYWRAQNYLEKPDSFFNGIYYGTTDTGESAPIWSVRFMEKTPKAPVQVIDGEAYVKELKRTSTRHEYEIITSTKARIRENTLFFPGWKVFIDGKPAVMEFQDQQNRGLITFFVESGKHRVDVQFGETKLRLIANMMSGFSLLILFLYSVKVKKIW